MAQHGEPVSKRPAPCTTCGTCPTCGSKGNRWPSTPPVWWGSPTQVSPLTWGSGSQRINDTTMINLNSTATSTTDAMEQLMKNQQG